MGGCGGFPWTELLRAEPAIAGTWLDEWGTVHFITWQEWDQAWSAWAPRWYSNLDGVMLAQNAWWNPYFPLEYSRFDWTEQGGSTYYCQTAFAEPTLGAARRVPAADAADLVGGCGGFSWTRMSP